MPNEDGTVLERGLRLVAERPGVSPPAADTRIRAVYDDVQAVLRVPVVDPFFRSLARHPDYLERAWGAVKPLARCVDFERAADELRVSALQEPLVDTAGMDIGAMEQAAEPLRAGIDTLHYLLPKVLLIASVLDRAAPAEAGSAAGPAPDLEATIPTGVATGTASLEPVRSDRTDERVAALFRSITEGYRSPVVPYHYRILATWPDLLDELWQAISPRIGAPDYQSRRQALIDESHARARAWAVPPAPVPEGQADEIRALLSAFRLKLIPEAMLDIVLIKDTLGDPGTADSPFSVQRTER